ncbi:MAG: shikimate dehydrogenase [Pseudochelatococcus sp.]|jgi:shikimate dehydrogenase|uniref:shikimate dehydrogenase n=1 Tax=Pseudochelatococcus sp. TaxID=2020869 RepID=UPI003D9059C3
MTQSSPQSFPRACIIGFPARHSRSPLIHRFWLREHGIAGDYDIAEVSPDDFPAFIRNLAAGGRVGANVTVPHKEAAFRLVDEATDTARALGAVNTLWFENGRLWGDNTDVAGFLANLDAGAPGWQEATPVATVLGAGGAARAVVYGLLARGVGRVVIVNRTLARAQALVDHFEGLSGGRIEAADWDGLARLLPDTALLVNTTSLGMHGQPPLPVDPDPMPDGAVVTDAVYVPLETPLLVAARRRGLRTVGGLGMLLHQAASGFARWFGVMPVVSQALQDHVVADLQEAAKGGKA